MICFKLIFLTLWLISTALIGDYIVFKSEYSSSRLFRAFADSFVHAAIGCISSLLFLNRELNLSSPVYFVQVAFCTLVSSLIDIDHFFVAKSVYFKDLTGLKQRGIFHCSSFWLILTPIILYLSYAYKNKNLYIAAWMLIIASSSHHIRDGNRRGLWFWPFGNTPALNTYVYISLIAVMPHIFSMLYFYMKPLVLRHTAINYKAIV